MPTQTSPTIHQYHIGSTLTGTLKHSATLLTECRRNIIHSCHLVSSPDFSCVKSEHLVQNVIAVDHANLEDCQCYEEDAGGDLDRENLGVKADQAESSSPVESLPSIEHGDSACAANDLRLNFAAEGSVKRNNGVVLLGQQ